MIITTLLKVLSKQQFGFITKDDLKVIKAEMPNLKVLIRCGCERYVELACHAQKRMELVEQQGDYVRDVSLPARVIDEMADDPSIDFQIKQAIQTMRSW
jgi:hypothetical protein